MTEYTPSMSPGFSLGGCGYYQGKSYILRTAKMWAPAYFPKRMKVIAGDKKRARKTFVQFGTGPVQKQLLFRQNAPHCIALALRFPKVVKGT